MACEVINLEFLKDLKRGDKRSVINFCIRMKLIASGIECPTCKLPMTLYEDDKETDGLVWSCPVQSGNCTHPTQSVRRCSWFDGTRLPLIDILIIIYLWVDKFECVQISNEIYVSRGEIYTWIYMCEDVCVEIVLQESVLLGGPGVIVEVYEAKSSRYNSNIAQIAGECVFLVAERGTNKCFAHVNENRDKTVLLNILYNRVLPGTIIVAYGWNIRDCYQEKINLERNNNMTFMEDEHGPDTRESFWTLIENAIYGRKTEYKFDSAVAEFMWRHFHQGDCQALLRSFLKCISVENHLCKHSRVVNGNIILESL